MKTDVLILGGGTSAVSAALSLGDLGVKCIVVEETDWVGGQLTAQSVPSDEHIWIEQFGSTGRYREFRNRLRAYYKANYPLSARSKADPFLNPGAGYVSPICAEPGVIHDVLRSMLAPHVANGCVTILLEHEIETVTKSGDRIIGARVLDKRTGKSVDIEAKIFIEATETGDVLALADIEYVVGFESKAMTGEPSAPDEYQSGNIQAFSSCFAMSYDPNSDRTIDKPNDYEYWRNFKMPFYDHNWVSWHSIEPRSLKEIIFNFDPLPNLDPLTVRANQKDNPGSANLWTFRRILAASHMEHPEKFTDISLVNWPQLDYINGSIIDVSKEEKAKNIAAAKDQSLSLLYWMQTEAPRTDGKTGWPGLYLRKDVVDTKDGLAKHVYVREARRIKALYTVTEQDISYAIRGDAGAKKYADSVGVGHYRIDLHPSTAGDNYLDVASCPYQIPVSSMIPVATENLIAAGKSIGVTHITNGCFRLHPTEWNIGESAGVLAALSIRSGKSPHAFASGKDLNDLQAQLLHQGVELEWPTVAPY